MTMSNKLKTTEKKKTCLWKAQIIITLLDYTIAEQNS